LVQHHRPNRGSPAAPGVTGRTGGHRLRQGSPAEPAYAGRSGAARRRGQKPRRLRSGLAGDWHRSGAEGKR